uniref:NADH dehydrogenase subunit 2 n=1 Tax=Panagrolaimus sp. PS1159 TaxID=55785 RepID=A0AC35GSZ1_9BILA
MFGNGNFLFSTVLALRLFQSRKSNKKWTKEELTLFGILIIHRICEALKHNITVFLPTDNQSVQALSNLLPIITLLSLHSGPFWIKAILSITLFSDPFQIPSDWFSTAGILLSNFYLCLICSVLFFPISDTFLFWILSLASPSNRIVLFLCSIMGHLIVQNKCKNSSAVFYLAVAASFYYTGNSHSLATLDLSSAYTRLPFYNPVFVGIQLFLVSYSTPIMLLIL